MRLKYKLAMETIERFEGFSATAYICPAGITTIGYGRTQGSMERTTKHQERHWLLQELYALNLFLNETVQPRLNQYQMAALLSFVYNCGKGAFIRSTLRKRLNESNFTAASLEFLRWNKGGGRVLPGLTRRRQAEVALFNR